MKSYQLTPAQQAEVDAAVAKGREKYAPIAGIVMESPLAPELAERFEEPTEEDVRVYLRTQLPEEQFIENLFNCPLSAFGGISPKQYGDEHGWQYVIATVRRMYG